MTYTFAMFNYSAKLEQINADSCYMKKVIRLIACLLHYPVCQADWVSTAFNVKIIFSIVNDSWMLTVEMQYIVKEQYIFLNEIVQHNLTEKVSHVTVVEWTLWNTVRYYQVCGFKLWYH